MIAEQDILGLEGLVEVGVRSNLAAVLPDRWADRVFVSALDPVEDDPESLGTPCVVVTARKQEADPPKTNMWRLLVEIDVRASLDETTRDEVSAVLRVIENDIICSLDTRLASDTIHCADAEFTEGWERGTDGPVLSHKAAADVWAFIKLEEPTVSYSSAFSSAFDIS